MQIATTIQELSELDDHSVSLTLTLGLEQNIIANNSWQVEENLPQFRAMLNELIMLLDSPKESDVLMALTIFRKFSSSTFQRKHFYVKIKADCSVLKVKFRQLKNSTMLI